MHEGAVHAVDIQLFVWCLLALYNDVNLAFSVISDDVCSLPVGHAHQVDVSG